MASQMLYTYEWETRFWGTQFPTHISVPADILCSWNLQQSVDLYCGAGDPTLCPVGVVTTGCLNSLESHPFS